MVSKFIKLTEKPAWEKLSKRELLGDPKASRVSVVYNGIIRPKELQGGLGTWQ